MEIKHINLSVRTKEKLGEEVYGNSSEAGISKKEYVPLMVQMLLEDIGDMISETDNQLRFVTTRAETHRFLGWGLTTFYRCISSAQFGEGEETKRMGSGQFHPCKS